MLSISSDKSSIHVIGLYTPAVLMRFERSLLGELKETASAKNLNLSQLVGSDSGLIAVLLSFQRVANERNWNVSLVGANDGIKGLIKLSQLEGFFTLSDSQ